jgi:spore germination protein YaaH
MNIYGAETSKYSMGYLYSGTTSEQISYISRTNNSINTVSPSYFDINADGSINVNIPSTELIDYAHSQGLKVIPFLSNHWNRNAGIAALQNADTLSTEIANYIAVYNLDGINVDIENVTESERDLYTNFVAALRQKVPA